MYDTVLGELSTRILVALIESGKISSVEGVLTGYSAVFHQIKQMDEEAHSRHKKS